MHDGWFDRIAPSYRLALDHFVGAINGENPVGPSLSEALGSVQAPEAVATKKGGSTFDTLNGNVLSR